MFDFKKLKVVKKHPLDKSFSSFVGIRRGDNGTLEFSLPRGFDNFPESDFSSVKNTFFKMYKTFQKFEKNHHKNMSDTKPSGKDSIERANNAYHFKDSDDNEVILYSKIRMIESIFETYRDLSLDTVESYLCTGDQVDFSKIENYLDKAVYLDDDVVYIDEMDYERKIINYKDNDLVGMFCFVLGELSVELENDVDQKVLELSDLFVGKHLSPDQKIFEEFYFESTINALKDILCDIDRSTAYKDPRYWTLFEALERFLYGELDMESTKEEGIFWGISNFYQIWEDMCNHHMIKHCLKSSDQEVFYADTELEISGSRFSNRTFGGRYVFLKDGAENPFFIEFRGQRRWMRPDIVIKNNHEDIDVLAKHVKILKKNESLTSFDLELTLREDSREIFNKAYAKFRDDLKRKMKGGRHRFFRNTDFFTSYPRAKFDVIFDFYNQFYKKKTQDSENRKDFFLVDWKYVDLFFLYEKSEKLDMDINKQLSYELCLSSQNTEISIESQFGIPWYFAEDFTAPYYLCSDAESSKLYNRILLSQIKIIQVNFTFVQQEYLKYA